MVLPLLEHRMAASDHNRALWAQGVQLNALTWCSHSSRVMKNLEVWGWLGWVAGVLEKAERAMRVERA